MVQTLTDIETVLPRLICPNCFRSHLEAVLRCDLDRRDCLPAVHCISCGYSFGPTIVERELEAFQRLVAEMPCPSCGRSSHVDFRCTLWDRQCNYVLVCNRCLERYELHI